MMISIICDNKTYEMAVKLAAFDRWRQYCFIRQAMAGGGGAEAMLEETL